MKNGIVKLITLYAHLKISKFIKVNPKSNRYHIYGHVYTQTHTPVPTPAPPLRTRKNVIAKKDDVL